MICNSYAHMHTLVILADLFVIKVCVSLVVCVAFFTIKKLMYNVIQLEN